MPLLRRAFDTQHHENAPVGIHLHDDVRDIVGRPDVVFGIDAQTVRIGKDAVSQRTDVAAVAVEFHQHMLAAVEDEDMAFGIERDTGARAEVDPLGQLEDVGYRFVPEIGDVG